ncbi:MAG: hypothetical protein KBD01_18465, partial [Acidobacteria bacterium]|nr:hypothetical protein [Acidobacteriota bacterium]
MLLAAAASLLATAAGAQSEAPDYPHGEYSDDCSLCHRPDAWTPAQVSREFDHGRSGFALDGAHASAQCRACHESLEFKTAPSSCVDCHQDVHRGELGTDCARCHGTRSFVDPAEQKRRHAATRFPLTGAHASVDCESCHADAVQGRLAFVNTPMECFGCHAEEYRTTTDPDHATAGFPHECEQCHAPTLWNATRFDHARTGFPLVGAHREATCRECHRGGFRDARSECEACHLTEYQATARPPHAASHIPADCDACHAPSSWSPAPYNHAGTSFPLTGAHVGQDCNACHADGVYDGKPTECVSCHGDEYDATTDPDHEAARFPTDCTQCHTTVTWIGATYDHGQTSFPLTGAHVAQDCNACHADGVYDGKPTECVSCHQDDYNGTTDPNHRTAGFPTDCTQCHTTTTWEGADFDHNDTSFPLTGAHVSQTCNACHADGVYDGKPTECVSCHGDEYDATTDPDHEAARFPTDC